MATTTPFDYHDNEDNHGNYQYITLKQVIDGFMLEGQLDDSLFKNIRRFALLKYAKEGIAEINKDGLSDVYAMEITVPDSLYFALPHDFVDYVRVSVVARDETTDSFRLLVLDVNDNINIADGYLQDNNADILFDNDGYILKADSSNAYAKPYKKYAFDNNVSSPTLDTTKLCKHGEFSIDKVHGKILFSSDLADHEIVMEYLSDGLAYDTYNEGSIKVHKNTIQLLRDWIFWKSIEYRQNVSLGQKQAALLRFKTTRHQTKVKMAGLDLFKISRAMRIMSKNI